MISSIGRDAVRLAGDGGRGVSAGLQGRRQRGLGWAGLGVAGGRGSGSGSGSGRPAPRSALWSLQSLRCGAVLARCLRSACGACGAERTAMAAARCGHSGRAWPSRATSANQRHAPATPRRAGAGAPSPFVRGATVETLVARRGTWATRRARRRPAPASTGQPSAAPLRRCAARPRPVARGRPVARCPLPLPAASCQLPSPRHGRYPRRCLRRGVTAGPWAGRAPATSLVAGGLAATNDRERAHPPSCPLRLLAHGGRAGRACGQLLARARPMGRRRRGGDMARCGRRS